MSFVHPRHCYAADKLSICFYKLKTTVGEYQNEIKTKRFKKPSQLKHTKGCFLNKRKLSSRKKESVWVATIRK